MGGDPPLSNYITPVARAVSDVISRVFNSPIGYAVLYSIPLAFGIKQLKLYNKLARLRFDDIPYQIRRADSLGDRWMACKYLVLGSLFVPLTGCAIAYRGYCRFMSDGEVDRLIFYDISRNLGNSMRASSDAQARYMSEALSVGTKGASESFRSMSHELRADIGKVKSKLNFS